MVSLLAVNKRLLTKIVLMLNGKSFLYNCNALVSWCSGARSYKGLYLQLYRRRPWGVKVIYRPQIN